MSGSTPQTKLWLVSRGGEIESEPRSVEEIRRLPEYPNLWVWKEGMENWAAPQDVPEFQEPEPVSPQAQPEAAPRPEPKPSPGLAARAQAKAARAALVPTAPEKKPRPLIVVAAVIAVLLVLGALGLRRLMRPKPAAPPAPPPAATASPKPVARSAPPPAAAPAPAAVQPAAPAAVQKEPALSATGQDIPDRTGDPYLGAIVMDASNGDVLFEDHADTPGYPASMIKLMDLLIILQYNESGAVGMEDKVKVTAEAARMGGSQVYLKEGEEFTVDELLYAMVVQSANDAATALALTIAGTKDAFVETMNNRAKSMRMDSTAFHSVHGLPPGPGQQPDVSTARDIALLCRQLVKRPDALKYTSTREKGFRNDTFIMRTHNPLLASVDGCDGLKTGYFTKAGFSIAATAERDSMRVIAVVLGSKDKAMRNAKAAELIGRGLVEIRRKQVQIVEPTNAIPTSTGAGIAAEPGTP